jgi:hypothetical protein
MRRRPGLLILRKATLSTAAGFIIAIIFSAAIAFGPPWSGTLAALLHPIEQAGTDAGMVIFARSFAQRRPALDFDRRIAGPEPRYVFVDIDQGSCEHYRGPNAQDCLGAHPAPFDLVWDIVVAVLEGAPRVVVIDTPVPADTDLRSLRLKAGAAGTPIVVAVPVRPAGESLSGYLDRSSISLDDIEHAGNAVAGAAVAQITKEDRDGKLRAYPPAVSILDRAGAPIAVPTLPFAAAILAIAPHSGVALLRRAFPANASHTRHEGDAAAAKLIERFSIPPQSIIVPQRYDNSLRTLYSLEPLSLSEPQGQRYDNFYLHLPIKEHVAERKITELDPSAIADAVVVVGTSDPAGRDWHDTPLGQMAGAELIINAIRAYVSFKPLSDSAEPFGRFWHKVAIAGEAALVFWVGWALIFALLQYGPRAWQRLCRLASLGHAGRRVCRRAGDAVVSILVVFVFIMTTCVACLWIIDLEVGTTAIALPQGRPVDVVTPLLALTLEGLVEAIAVVLAFAHRALETLWIGAERALKTIAVMLGR